MLWRRVETRVAGVCWFFVRVAHAVAYKQASKSRGVCFYVVACPIVRMGRGILRQVLNDYKSPVQKAGLATHDAQRAAAYKVLIEAYVADRAQLAAEAKASMKCEYADNLEPLQALDQAMFLGTGGTTLLDFVVPEKHRPRRLLPHERRYVVDATALPHALCSGLGCAKRLCIKDQLTGATRLEVQWTGKRMVLFEVLDQCPKQQPSRDCAFSFGNMRGWACIAPYIVTIVGC